MATFASAAIVALVAALVLTPLVRYLARRQGLLDKPDYRKVHPIPIPRLGGIAIAAAFYLGLAAAILVTSPGPNRLIEADQLVAVLIGVALIVCIGIVDDLFGMRARVKLSAQVSIAIVVALLGLAIEHFDGPWGRIGLGVWSIPVTVIWFVLVMNAINLIDGLDGLASGVVLIAMGALYLVSVRAGIPLPLAAVLGAGAGAVLGFLPFNLSPASIIMGDTGSILLGFLVAAVGITITQSGSPAAAPWVPIIVLAVPLLDTAWAVTRRAIARSPIFAPDRKHVHHRLLAAGLSQGNAMLLLWAISASFGLVGVLIAR